MFGLVEGGDIFGTITELDTHQSGDPDKVKIYMQIIVFSFSIIFAIIVLNLIIALFNSAYEQSMKVCQFHNYLHLSMFYLSF